MRKLYILGLIALAAIIIGFAWAEQITLTTYYPAPYGVYRQFTTTGNTNLATQEGNVGIGTTNAGARLDVNGNIKIVDGNQADGKVLTSDGDGLGTWQRAVVLEHGSVNVSSGQSSVQVGFSQVYTNLPTVVATPVKVGTTLKSDCVLVWITELTNSHVVFDVDSIQTDKRVFETFPEDNVRIDYVVISND